MNTTSAPASRFPQCKICGARLPATTWRLRSCIPCQLPTDKPRLRLVHGDNMHHSAPTGSTEYADASQQQDAR